MSRIEQIINEMEEYLDGCKAQAFSNSKRIVVEKDVIDDMLVELRMRTPEEIKKYQKIIATLKKVKPDTLTAREALNLIYDLTEEVSYL
jgi:DNA mismatch repair ATPase MutS